MKQVKYEFYKVFHNHLTVIMLFGFLTVNLILFLWQSTTKYGYVIESAEDYNHLEAQYQEMPIREAYEELAERTDFMTNMEIIESAQQNNDTMLLEYLMTNDPGLLEKYIHLQEENKLPIVTERSAIRLLYEQAMHINNYPEYIAGIQEQADQMSAASIFNQPNTFSYRNIMKTPIDFENNKNLSLSFGKSTGLVSFSDFYATDIFVLFLMLLISARLFGDEKEKGLLVLVKSTRNGRFRTVFAKILNIFITSSVVALLFYGTNMIVANKLFGFGDITRYIQSMEEFGGSNIVISVRQYLICYFGGKVFITFVFALLFSAAFSLFHNNAVAIFSIFGVVCGFFLAYRYIPHLSIFNALKFLNPVAVLDIMNVVAEYNNINLFGFPCNRISAILVVMATFIILFVAIVICLYLSKTSTRSRLKLIPKVMEYVHAFLAKFYGISLLWHEFCKLAFSRKMLLIPVILVLFIINSIMETEPVYSFDNTVYNSYLNELEGELTEEKAAYIYAEQERFQNLPAEASRFMKQLEEGIITRNRYDYEMFLLETFSKRETGFNKVLEQFYHIKALREAGIKAGFVNQFSSDYLWNHSERDTALGLLTLLLTIVLTAVVFCQEYKQGMIHIMNSTQNGKRMLYRSKIVVAIVFSFSFMAVYVPQYVNSYHFYRLSDLSLPIKNINLFTNCPFEISIGSFILLTHIMQLTTIMAVMFVTVFFSVKLKNQIVTIIVTLVFLAVPLILFLCGIQFAKYMPFANAFVLNHAIQSGNAGIISCISLILTLAIGLLFGGLSYLEFCNLRRSENAS